MPEPQTVGVVEAEDDWLCDSVTLAVALAHTVLVLGAVVGMGLLLSVPETHALRD